MQTTKPVHPLGRTLSQGVPEGLAPRLFRAGFIEAGGNPGVGSPEVVETFKAL
jgi:hypothetical protein